MAKQTLTLIALFAFTVALLPAVAMAQTLDELRVAGTVGERFDGYALVRAKDAGDEVRAMVDEINAKRKEIYAQRAEQEGVSVADVGRVYAVTIFEKAPVGTWFVDAEGSWTRKGDQ